MCGARARALAPSLWHPPQNCARGKALHDTAPACLHRTGLLSQSRSAMEVLQYKCCCGHVAVQRQRCSAVDPSHQGLHTHQRLATSA